MDSEWDTYTGHGEQPTPANGSERQRHRKAVGTPYVGGRYVGIRNDWFGLQLIQNQGRGNFFLSASSPGLYSSCSSIMKVLTAPVVHNQRRARWLAGSCKSSKLDQTPRLVGIWSNTARAGLRYSGCYVVVEWYARAGPRRHSRLDSREGQLC